MEKKFSKEIETLKNNQTEILEMRKMFTPIKKKKEREKRRKTD